MHDHNHDEGPPNEEDIMDMLRFVCRTGNCDDYDKGQSLCTNEDCPIFEELY